MGPIDDKKKKPDENPKKNEIEEKKLEDISGGIFPLFDDGSDINRIFQSRVEKDLFED